MVEHRPTAVIIRELGFLLDELIIADRHQAEQDAHDPEHPRAAHPPRPPPPFRASDRVRIITPDKYFGRIGMIPGRRGRHFWNIALERECEDDACVIIHKKTSSLVLESSYRDEDNQDEEQHE